jgi:hypothetical protein
LHRVRIDLVDRNQRGHAFAILLLPGTEARRLLRDRLIERSPMTSTISP